MKRVIFTRTQLNEGDVIRLGETRLTFCSESPKLSSTTYVSLNER